jgi:ABC-2 type transport system permease protein
VIDTLSQVLYRQVYSFRPLVVSGSLDTILLKPYHPFLKILVGGVDILDLFLLIPYTLIAIFFALKGQIVIFNLIAFLALFINALWIATSFHIIVLAIGVLTTDVDHTILIYRDMTSLGRFPMAIYKEPIKSFFTFIIPVGIMTSFPPQALLGALSPGSIGIAFVISSVLFGSSLILWNYALKQYQSWGG